MKRPVCSILELSKMVYYFVHTFFNIQNSVYRNDIAQVKS